MTSTSPSFDLQSIFEEEAFVRGLARSLLFDEHQVDDVVQQTWLLAIKRPVARPEDGSPRAWLATVVRNLVSNEHRASQRRDRREHEAAVAEALPSTADLLEQQDNRRMMVEAVGELTEPYRSAILLRYFEQLPPRQIAARLRLPRATVASRLKRGLQMLRERLDVVKGGDRRAWCLGLVPLAAAPRVTAGVLSVKAASWLGILMMMKNIWLSAFVLALLVSLAFSYFWGIDNAPPPASVTAEASVTGADIEQAPVLAESSTSAVGTRVAVGETKAQKEIDSVNAALAGFRGRFMRPDGEPAAGAKIRILSVDPMTIYGAERAPLSGSRSPIGPQGSEALCDEDGRFEVHGFWPRGMHALHAGLGSEYPLLQILSQSPGPGQIVELGTFHAVQKGVIEGLVVGEDSEPLADALIWCADVPGVVFAAAPIDRLTADGAIFLSLPDVASAEGPEVDAAGYHRHLRKHLSKDAVQAKRGSDYVVMDIPEWGKRFLEYLPRVHTRTDAEGRFRLVGVDPGDNVLVVRAKGYANGGKARVAVRVDRVRKLSKIRMHRGNSLRGVVCDAEGELLAGVELRAAYRPSVGLTGVLFADATVLTTAKGEFVVPDLPRGEAVIAVRRDAQSAWNVLGLFETDEEDIELRLPARTALHVSVTNTGGGVIRDVTFELQQGPPLGEFARIGFARPLSFQDTSFEDTSLEDRLTVADDGHFEFSDLEPGLYTLSARAEGFALACKPIHVRPDQERVTMVMEASAGLEVLVRETSGAPIEGAGVFVLHNDVPAWSRSLLFSYGAIDGWDRIPLFVGDTDAEGMLRSMDLAAGNSSILVRHPGFGVADAYCELPGKMEVTLARPGVVFGQLFEHGKPASPKNYRITATAEDKKNSQTPDVTMQARLGEDGRFRMEGLAPGRYKIGVKPSAGDVASLGGLIAKVKPSWDFFNRDREVAVVVESEGQHELVFDVDPNIVPGGGFRFSGKVSVNGAGAAGLRFVAGTAMRRPSFCETDASGHFLAEGLLAREFYMRLVDPKQQGSVIWSGFVDLSKGKDVSLELELETASLSGIVIGHDGQPAPNQRVVIRGKGLTRAGHSDYEIRSDAQGEFSLQVTAGEYTLHASGDRGNVTQPALRLAPGRALPVRLEMTSKGLVSGRVSLRGASFSELSYVMIRQVSKTTGLGWDLRKVEGDRFFFVLAEEGEFELQIVDGDMNYHHAIPSTIQLGETGATGLVLRVGDPVDK